MGEIWRRRRSARTVGGTEWVLIWWPVQRLIPLLLHPYARQNLPRTIPAVRQPLETRPEQTPSSPPPLPILRPSTSRAIRCSSQQSRDEN